MGKIQQSHINKKYIYEARVHLTHHRMQNRHTKISTFTIFKDKTLTLEVETKISVPITIREEIFLGFSEDKNFCVK